MTGSFKKIDTLENMIQTAEKTREFYTQAREYNNRMQRLYYLRHKDELKVKKRAYYVNRVKKVNSILKDLNLPE